MAWSTVPFGKYAGKTLPEIIVRDLDWFFWVVSKLYRTLADEGEELARKARAIPNPHRKRLEVEYRYELGGRFAASHSSKPTVPGIPGGSLDFRTSISLGLCAERSMTSERAAS